LEVSRTPVREALLALAQDGLVVRARGWSVRDHGPEEILRILEARAAVEGAAAGLAAQRIDDAGLARLKGLATEMERADQSRQILNQLNREFHAVITEAAGNALLVQFSKRTHISHWNFSIPMISPISPPGDDEVVNAEHRAIIEHLEAREADRAAQTVRTHIERSRAIVAASLEITEPPH
jgi:DNA-binding GntR family transcriptional regulator